MNNKMKEEITAIVSTIIFVISAAAKTVEELEKFKISIDVLMIASALITITCVLIIGRELKESKIIAERNAALSSEIEKLKLKNAELSSLNEKLMDTIKYNDAKITELELRVSDGNKILESRAEVTFDVSRKKYILSYEKRYVIIADAIKWYECQFYSNICLSNAEASQKYYRDHPISWDDLNIRAELRYKNIGDSKFSKTKQVKVLQVAEGNNYKKFHIQYETKKGVLPITKGAEIILNYSYEVPVTLWGSYLNRYITYWREKTDVILRLNAQSVEPFDINVYQTNHVTGNPYLKDIKCESDSRKGQTSYIIKLPNDDSCKYTVWWDANKIFGEENLNTDMTADHSQQTQY